MKLTDAGCEGEVTATVDVVSGLVVSPAAARLPPGATLTPEITGGSGQVRCELAENPTGARLEGCTYAAGASPGTDLLRVHDTSLGEFLDVKLTVEPGAGLHVVGGGHLFLPVGSLFAPSPTGGSGELTIEADGEVVEVVHGLLHALKPGATTVVIKDRYSDLSQRVPVDVLDAIAPDVPRDGERTNHGQILAAGDLNSDGYPDAVLGFIELSLEAHFGGGVLVFAGGPEGLGPEPVQRFGGVSKEETLGRAVAVADLDNDGEQDLLIGADKRDHGAVNVGAVQIHRGIAGGFFEQEPAEELVGEFAYGRMGSALAVCDFDADGWLDVAVGALTDADQATTQVASEQGAVHVYRGAAEGLPEKPTFSLFGELPDGKGGWRPAAGAQLGTALAAGDLDGDGRCDLVAGAPEGEVSSGEGDGFVLIFQGTTEEGLTLTRHPARVVLPEVAGGEFGRRVDVGDIDLDGRAELAVGHWRSSIGAPTGGSVWLFDGAEVLGGDPADPLATQAARWQLHGQGSGDQLGSDLDLADLDLDGRADLSVGAFLAQLSQADQGRVFAYRGLDLAAAPAGSDGSTWTPWFVRAGPRAGGRFGQALAAVGDVDRSGGADLLVLAGYDSSWGTEAGAAWLADDYGLLHLMSWPGRSAGADIGRGLAIFDTNADGRSELLIGAPGAPDQGAGANAGGLYRWDGEGEPSLRPADHPSHSGSDALGYHVSQAGDFDADGYADLAVVARKDSRPSSFGSSYVGGEACEEMASQAGAVFIYRGGPEGVSSEPAFAFWGSDASDYIYGVEGGFDHNGDGYDDVLVRSQAWSDVGGVAFLYGRPVVEGGINVLCQGEIWTGNNNFDRLGASGAPLGDLDGDGCDEVAVGATGEEFSGDWYNQGSVRIFWGWGGPGCPASPQVSTLVMYIVGTGLGSGLSGGLDVDGDGLPELLVGGAEYRQELTETGAAWLVPGSWMKELTRQEAPDMQLPDDDETDLNYLLPEDGLQVTLGLKGEVAAGLFGAAVLLIPDPVEPARGAVAVGTPQGDLGGVLLAGGVVIHRWGEGGLDPLPWGVVGGETHLPGGELGATLLRGSLGGRSVLVVGAPASDQRGLDNGAVYVVPLGP